MGEPCKEADLLNLASPRLSVGVPGVAQLVGPPGSDQGLDDKRKKL